MSTHDEVSQHDVEGLEQRLKVAQQEEKKAREEVARLLAKRQQLHQEKDVSLESHKAGKSWKHLLLGIAEASINGVRDAQKDNTELFLQDAEERLAETRVKRKSLELELSGKREGLWQRPRPPKSEDSD